MVGPNLGRQKEDLRVIFSLFFYRQEPQSRPRKEELI